MRSSRLVLLISFLSISFLSYSQIEVEDGSKPSFKDRVYFGGGFAMNGGSDSYGNRYYYFALSPIVGYMITPKLSAGSGITWQQINYTDAKVKLNQYGISPFVRYNLSKLFLYSEYNLINTPSYSSTGERRNYDRLLLGLGYSQPLGKRGAINGMALYDVLYNPSDRVFVSPWVFRVFFSF